MLHLQAPVQYTKLFSKLVDQVPSKPWTVMGPHLSKCLNVDLEDVFDFVQENPIAAASIGQVHRARLVKGSPHSGSRDVVVKVCYPNSEALVGTVLHIHTHTARLVVLGFLMHTTTGVGLHRLRLGLHGNVQPAVTTRDGQLLQGASQTVRTLHTAPPKSCCCTLS